MSIDPRDFGRLEAEVIALKAQNTRLEDQIKRQGEKLDILVQAVTEAKGGWKMLMLVGAASASAGALVAKTVGLLKGF